MNKKLVTLLLAAGIAVIFIATGLQAGTTVSDSITMDYNKYKKRTKTPPKTAYVVFTHKKHAEDYKISCGDCHHDKDGKPLALKTGDNVQKCVECHTKLEKAKQKKGEKEDILVLENAMHGNCVDCHKALKKEGNKNAPTACGQCHVSLTKK
ncbi:MAG: cytochrome c family protein [Proteobacteria bacterium]|nr:cytochrome c family protein [Pseudomonadota bacterium]MBU1386388.1 cytochrome c family protein [Pseudomonadota bacterium]MBU1544499.1 cytochrome c family protein [Pseudomonadota bacterium]